MKKLISTTVLFSTIFAQSIFAAAPVAPVVAGTVQAITELTNETEVKFVVKDGIVLDAEGKIAAAGNYKTLDGLDIEVNEKGEIVQK